MARTERESDNRRREMADLLVLSRPAKSMQNGAGFSKKLEHTGPAEKERVASVPQREQLVIRQSRLCQKEKEQSRLSRAPNHEEGESRGGREPNLDEREREMRAGAWRGKGGLHGKGRLVPRRKGRASKNSLPRRCRRKHERVSGRKSSPGRSAES